MSSCERGEGREVIRIDDDDDVRRIRDICNVLRRLWKKS